MGKRAKGKRTGKFADVIGHEVDVPGREFKQNSPGIFYRGKVVKKDPSRKDCVIIKFPDDSTAYWWPVNKVRSWLVDSHADQHLSSRSFDEDEVMHDSEAEFTDSGGATDEELAASVLIELSRDSTFHPPYTPPGSTPLSSMLPASTQLMDEGGLAGAKQQQQQQPVLGRQRQLELLHAAQAELHHRGAPQASTSTAGSSDQADGLVNGHQSLPSTWGSHWGFASLADNFLHSFQHPAVDKFASSGGANWPPVRRTGSLNELSATHPGRKRSQSPDPVSEIGIGSRQRSRQRSRLRTWSPGPPASSNLQPVAGPAGGWSRWLPTDASPMVSRFSGADHGKENLLLDFSPREPVFERKRASAQGQHDPFAPALARPLHSESDTLGASEASAGGPDSADADSATHHIDFLSVRDDSSSKWGSPPPGGLALMAAAAAHGHPKQP